MPTFFCNRCDDETEHSEEEVFERWQDTAVDDDDLDRTEFISRVNGDVAVLYTCLKCHTSFEML